MKQFFKMLLASVVGVLLAGLLLIFLTIGILAAAISFDAPAVVIADKSVMVIKFDKAIVDRQVKNPLSFLISDYSDNLGLNTIYKGLQRAKTDDRIKGVFLDVSTLNASLANIEEIRNALKDFHSSGKFIIAYADDYSQSAYFLATAADKIYVNPFGNFYLNGLSSQTMFYKGLTDKLGIEMQIIRHGKFKSAVEPFMLNQMSPESKEQTLGFIGSMWSTIVEEISISRSPSPAQINEWTNTLAITSPQDALDKNLVDGLKYKDEILDELAKLTETNVTKDLATVSIKDYTESPDATLKLHDNKIAVIYGSGQIEYGSNKDGSMMSDDVARDLRKARDDDKVKAVVFRVNSPGGSVTASEIIAREVELTMQKKPVIISMGGMAASGGYWVSAPAQKIFANKTTITGSIGVFGMLPNIEKGMHQHLGLTVDGVKTNEESGSLYNIYAPLSPKKRAAIQAQIEQIYLQFTTKVATGRKMTVANVDSIGQGRVWSGADALKLGLVDAFGGLYDAIEAAREAANLTEFRLEELPVEKNPFEMVGSLASSVRIFQSTNELEHIYIQYNRMMEQLGNTGILARMPFDISVE